MGVRFVARLVVGLALLFPVVVSGFPSSGQAVRAIQVPSIAFTVEPISAERTRLIVRFQDGQTATYEARAVDLSYKPDGLVLDIKGPGTLEYGVVKTTFEAIRLTYNDGAFVRMEGGSSLR